MRLEWPMVLSLNDAFGAFEGRTHITHFDLFLTLDDWRSLQVGVEVFFVGRHTRRGRCPFDLQESGSFHRIPLLLGHNGQKVLLADHFGARHRLN